MCACVGGPPGGPGGGTSHLCSEHASCSPPRWGSPPGEWAVCSGASVTGCREEGSPARVWAPGTSRAGQPHRPRPPRGLRPAGRGLPAARGLRRTVQQRLLHDGCGFSGQNVQALGDLAREHRPHTAAAPGAAEDRAEPCRWRACPGPVLMKPGLSSICLAARPFTAASYCPEDKSDHVPSLFKVLGGLPWHRFSNFFFFNEVKPFFKQNLTILTWRAGVSGTFYCHL